MQIALLLSNMPWKSMGQTNRQAWALALSDRNDIDEVWYAETLGWRAGDRADERIAGTKISVLRLQNPLPRGGDPLIFGARKMNELFWRWQISRRMKSRDVDCLALLVVFDPMAANVTRSVRAVRKIYDCLDLYSAQPQFSNRLCREHALRRLELRLMNHVDVVSVSAPALAARTPKSTPTIYRPGSTYRKTLSPSRRSAQGSWRIIDEAKTRAVYVGALDDYKFDSKVLERLLRYDPLLEIDVIGGREFGDKDQKNPDSDYDVRIRFHGKVRHEDLQEMIRGYSFGIVAMTDGPYSKYSFPLKVWDYLAAGIPVLSVGAPSLNGLNYGVATFESLAEFTIDKYKEFVEKAWSSSELQKLVEESSASERVREVLRFACSSGS